MVAGPECAYKRQTYSKEWVYDSAIMPMSLNRCVEFSKTRTRFLRTLGLGFPPFGRPPYLQLPKGWTLSFQTSQLELLGLLDFISIECQSSRRWTCARSALRGSFKDETGKQSCHRLLTPLKKETSNYKLLQDPPLQVAAFGPVPPKKKLRLLLISYDYYLEYMGLLGMVSPCFLLFLLVERPQPATGCFCTGSKTGLVKLR